METAELNFSKLQTADKLDVLVVDDGSRGHALVWKLRQAERVGRLCLAPQKSGTEHEADNFALGSGAKVADIVRLAEDLGIDLVVASQDDWLAAGLTDRLAERNIATFGPSQAAYQIESSKIYAKRLMQTYFVPTANYKAFYDADLAHRYVTEQVEQLGRHVYLKADGLVRGKGAFDGQDPAEAHRIIHDLMVRQVLGRAGTTILIEDYLPGEEVSLHAFADGQHSLPWISAQDYKRVGDGDTGPNTGGAGTIAPVPWFDETQSRRAHQQVGRPVLEGLWMQQRPFHGILYPGLKVTKTGLNVVEYNGRGGNPEISTYLRLLESDLLELMVASVCGTLDRHKLTWRDGYAVDVVAMSHGYPGKPSVGHTITGLKDVGREDDDTLIFNAGMVNQDDQWRTAGGRVFDVTTVAETLPKALDKAYEKLEQINFKGMHYRHDIGQRPSPY